MSLLKQFAHTTAQCKKRKDQSGFTLLELMIALFLGLLLIAGILQLYLSSKQAYRSQEANAQIQDSARFIVDTLARQIRYAGMRSDANKSFNDSFPTMTANEISWPADWQTDWRTGFTAGTSLLGQDAVNGDGIPQDRIYFRAQAYGAGFSDTLSGCSGQNLGAGGTVLDTDSNPVPLVDAEGNAISYSWSVIYVDDTDKTLKCIFNGVNTTIAENVLGMEINYKVNLENIEGYSTTASQAVMTAVQIEAYNDNADTASPAFMPPRNLWKYVTGVQVDLLIRSESTNITTEPQPVTFRGVITTPDQLQLYRTLSTAIMIRNAPGGNHSDFL